MTKEIAQMQLVYTSGGSKGANERSAERQQGREQEEHGQIIYKRREQAPTLRYNPQLCETFPLSVAHGAPPLPKGEAF